MQPNNTVTDNKKVALFMGAEDRGELLRFAHHPAHPLETAHLACVEGLHYHDNYSWLMPVVEKIWDKNSEQKGAYKIQINEETITYVDWTQVYGETIVFVERADHKGLLSAIYAAVIAFIDWYNLQGK